MSRKGDYSEQAFFQALAGLVSRRDTTSSGSASDQNLSQDEWVSVKLNRKIGPVLQAEDAFAKIMAETFAHDAGRVSPHSASASGCGAAAFRVPLHVSH